MARQLYIYVDGEREGPFPLEEVGEMLEAGTLGFDDYCQPVGSARRRRLREVFELVQEEEDEEDPSEEEVEEEEDESMAEEEADEPPGEPQPGRLLYSGHPALLNYPGAWLAALVCGVGGYLLGPQSLWYFIAGWVVVMGMVVYVLVDRTTRLYLVTRRRVEVIRGLLVKSSEEVLVRDIRTINVRRTGLRGLLGVGTVEFSSAGDKIDVAFEDIRGAQQVKRIVRALQDKEET